MINKSIYIVLSIINLSALVHFAGLENIMASFILFGGILLNHWLLVNGVEALAKAKPKSAFLVVKFFVLIGVFLYAMHSMPERILLCVSAYIFQLIILALSIKRDSKKIKDSHI